jgi:hypothetical protein
LFRPWRFLSSCARQSVQQRGEREQLPLRYRYGASTHIKPLRTILNVGIALGQSFASLPCLQALRFTRRDITLGLLIAQM